MRYTSLEDPVIAKKRAKELEKLKHQATSVARQKEAAYVMYKKDYDAKKRKLDLKKKQMDDFAGRASSRQSSRRSARVALLNQDDFDPTLNQSDDSDDKLPPLKTKEEFFAERIPTYLPVIYMKL